MRKECEGLVVIFVNFQENGIDCGVKLKCHDVALGI